MENVILRKFVWVGVAIVFVVVALIVISSGDVFVGNVVKGGNIKIGITGHFSGDYAGYGIPMKNAVELAIEETNRNGGVNGRLLELVVEDDESDVNGAASAINKLINIDNVDYIISAQASAMASVVAPVVQDNNKILMLTLASAPGLARSGDYVFRSVPSDSYQGNKMVELINGEFGSEKVAGLYINNAYGVGIKNIVGADDGVNVVSNEMFEPGASDFRTQLLKIKNSGADTMVLVAMSVEAPTIFKQIVELDLDVNVLGSETIKDESILEDSGENMEGVYMTFYDDNGKDYVGFAERYETRFNEKPSAYSMYAYDGVIALIEALASGDNVEKVKDELGSVGFNGASGTVGFDTEGDRTGIEYALYKVVDGQFVKQ